MNSPIVFLFWTSHMPGAAASSATQKKKQPFAAVVDKAVGYNGEKEDRRMFAGAQAGLRGERLEIRLSGRNEFDAVRRARPMLPEPVALFAGVSFDGAPVTVDSLFVPPARISDGATYPGEKLPRFINPFADLPQILPGESQSDMREPALDVAERLLPAEDERIMSLPGDGWSEAVVEGPGLADVEQHWLGGDDFVPPEVVSDQIKETTDMPADFSLEGIFFDVNQYGIDDARLSELDADFMRGAKFSERRDLAVLIVRGRQNLVERLVFRARDLFARDEMTGPAVASMIAELNYVVTLTNHERIFGSVADAGERALYQSIFRNSLQALTNLRGRLRVLRDALSAKNNEAIEHAKKLVTEFVPFVQFPLSASQPEATVTVHGTLYSLPQALTTWICAHGFKFEIVASTIVFKPTSTGFSSRIPATNPLRGASWDDLTGPDSEDPILSTVLDLLNYQMAVMSVEHGGFEIHVRPK